MTARVLAAVMALVAAALLAWILTHPSSQTSAPPAAASSPTVAATATAAAAATVVPGYRLAGTALGLRGRYAVFEAPDGTTEMYRVGEEVPGLGTLQRVGDVDAVLLTSSGEMRFQVRPAPTKVAENTPTVRRAKTPSPQSDPSESESSPSDDPAPPAS